MTAQLEFLYLIRYTYLVDRNLIVENYLNSDRDPTSSIACLKVVNSCLKVPLTFGTFVGHNSIIFWFVSVFASQLMQNRKKEIAKRPQINFILKQVEYRFRSCRLKNPGRFCLSHKGARQVVVNTRKSS